MTWRSSKSVPQRVAAIVAAAASIRLAWVLVGYYISNRAQRHHLEAAWFLFAAACVWLAIASKQRWQAHSLSALSVRYVAALAPAVGVSFLLYWPSLSVGLLSDDYVLLTEPVLNPDWQFVRPLPLAVWAGLFPLGGAAALHVLNVLLHGINAFLIFHLVPRILPASTMAGALAAGAFVSFPAAVEAVTWSSGVFDVLLTTFALAYVAALCRRTLPFQILAVAILMAALVTKETAVCLPLLGALVWTRRPVRIVTLAASAILVAAYVLLRLGTGEAPAVGAPLGYFVKEMVARPFATLGTPWKEAEIAAAPWLLGVLPQVLLGAIAIGCAASARSALRSVTWLIWVLAAVVPLGGYLFISHNLEGSRYLYLPLAGWSFWLAECIGRQPTRVFQRAALLALAFLCAMGAWGARRHQQSWTAAASLRDQILEEAISTAIAHRCGSVTFRNAPEAIEGAYVFRNGLTEAVGLGTHGEQARAATHCNFVWTGGRFAPATSP